MTRESTPEELARFDRVAAGDMDAFQEVYTTMGGIVRAWVARMGVRSDADIEDLVSTVWTKALLAVRAGRLRAPADHLPSWIQTIARNTVRDYHRKRARPSRRSVYIADVPHDIPDTSARSPEEIAIESETSRHLSEAIAALRPRYRSVICLKMDGMSAREVGAVLGCAEGTVRGTTFRAVGELRRSLVPECEAA